MSASDQIARIRTEFSTVTRLSHKHVVRYYDLEILADSYYLVMEFCPSGTLASLLDGTLPGLALVRKYTAQVSMPLISSYMSCVHAC